MLKVVIIFILLVVVIMTLGSKNDNGSCGGTKINGGSTEQINNTFDLKKYSTSHSRSIQDDINKSVVKNI